MIKCYIVEDEEPTLHQLIERVNRHEALYLTGFSASAEKAILEIERYKPQLLFLDMELPDLNGLDIIKVIQVKPNIIFTTAYDRYAVDAFNYEAVDFLLKPYSEERFNQAVDKVVKRIDRHPDLHLELQNLLRHWKPQTEFLTRIPSRIGDKIFVLNVEDIVYFNSKDKVVFAHRDHDYFIINFTLDELQNRLNPENFFRIHRSTIVNLDYIQTIEPLIGGTYVMTVKDKNRSQLQVSRNAGKAIRSHFNW